jgi:DNA invertase Pin-like site-specific DNA recombinase
VKDSELTHPLITPDHLRRKALIYIRQSSLEQVEKNTGSQAFQRNQIESAQAYGWRPDLMEVIDDDLGKSGSSAERRTGWQRMLEQIADNAVGAVFAVNVSRLARQMLAFAELITLASYHGVLLFVDNRIIDPRDANDLMTSGIGATIAEYENKKRTEHMSRSRMAKAKAGAVVSSLPVGWVKTPDGKYDFDPEVKDAIQAVIDTFMRVRSIRQTVKALTTARVKIPSRRGKTVSFINPTLDRVRRLLINPAYTGVYVFGKTQSQLGGRTLASGQSARVKVPEHLWVKQPNFLPAYMREEQQTEIKRMLKDNHFVRRNRPGRGRALTQGLLRCAVCGRSLCVTYHRGQSYSYGCGWETEPCTRFVSYEFDGYVLAEVFKVLKTPPLAMLQAAVAESSSQERDRLAWIKAERERLAHVERNARNDVDSTRGRLPRVHFDAQQKLESVLQEREEFERRVAAEEASRRPIDCNDQLQELCRLASDVPGLWHHPIVTHQERKDILRCLIDHIVVAATKEKIDATIAWMSGQKTELAIWRGNGRYNLVRELHAQGLTIFEIHKRLAAGMTSTGQSVKLTIGCLYEVHRKLGITPNRFSAEYQGLREKALTLNREGRSIEWIAEQFTSESYPSASDKPWTPDMIYGLLRALGTKPLRLEELHRGAITEARARGINYRQMAVEFNAKRIRRRDGQPWTARDIKKRWADLTILQRKRPRKGQPTAEPSQLAVAQS